MTERILLLASHAVAEYDDLRMFTDAGYDCFAPGGYENPSRSGEGIRPALPEAPEHPELVAAINRVRAEHGEPGPLIDAGKARLPDEVIDWADVIIVHHFPLPWIAGQWHRIGHKRVVWRTCGQSDAELERHMARYRERGLQIVRYSPAERRYFESAGGFAGSDALIRFGKYPGDYGPWDGKGLFVGNVTQWRGGDEPLGRGDAVGLSFYREATVGLNAIPAGDGSEALPGGLGKIDYDEMLRYLRHCRAYLYTGTTPASYTLGLIEAMLSGTPVVSIGSAAWAGPDALFEGDDLAELCADTPLVANLTLARLLADRDFAAECGERQRDRAKELFDVALISDQWRKFLA